MEQEIPIYLYHYTNIQGVAHILISRKIRFSPLTMLDDKHEEISKDLQHFKNYVFASSWTDIEDENILLGNMYGGQMKGVRIKMPTYMFKIYPNILTSDIFTGITPNTIHYNPTIIDKQQTFGKDYFVLLNYTNFLHKIE